MVEARRFLPFIVHVAVKRTHNQQTLDNSCTRVTNAAVAQTVIHDKG